MAINKPLKEILYLFTIMAKSTFPVKSLTQYETASKIFKTIYPSIKSSLVSIQTYPFADVSRLLEVEPFLYTLYQNSTPIKATSNMPLYWHSLAQAESTVTYAQ